MTERFAVLLTRPKDAETPPDLAAVEAVLEDAADRAGAVRVGPWEWKKQSTPADPPLPALAGFVVDFYECEAERA